MKSIHSHLLCFILILLSPTVLRTETVTLVPVADTGLLGNRPDNNLGVNLNFIAGTVSSGQNARSLIRFDVAGSIPEGSVINSVNLGLNITVAASGPGSNFDLHRFLVGWEEGTHTGNAGQLASAGETTWNNRFHPSTGWGTAGGESAVDYVALPSATQFMNLEGAYSFASTSQLVADVQGWLDDASVNHGWILISQSEGTLSTARRVASREDEVRTPELTIDYTPLPVFRITDVTHNDGVMDITWINGLGPYQIQLRPSLDEPWANFGSPTMNMSGAVPQSGKQGYVRIVSEQTARYRMVFQANWTSTTHPDQYPGGPHFSGLVGGTHNGDAIIWRTNQLASTGIKNVAEIGSKTALISEVNAVISNGDAENLLSGGGIGSGTGSVSLNFSVSRDYPLVSLVSMLAPSPDWFVGVDGLDLRDETGQWQDEIIVPLYLYDAGTDSGSSYGSGNQVTTPIDNVSLIEGFPSLVGEVLTPFGTFTFERLP